MKYLYNIIQLSVCTAAVSGFSLVSTEQSLVTHTFKIEETYVSTKTYLKYVQIKSDYSSSPRSCKPIQCKQLNTSFWV